jgi:alpha,alpha-trehalose phosphorylase
MRDHGELSFAPRLPERINRLGFRVVYQGRVLSVSVAGHQATYRVIDGEPLDIHHHGRQVTVTDRNLVLEIPPAPEVEPVHQPPHAAPRRRTRITSD